MSLLRLLPFLVHCIVPIQELHIIMYPSYSSVLPPEVLCSLLRLLPIQVYCSPNSRTTYYNVSICIVLYYPLKSLKSDYPSV